MNVMKFLGVFPLFCRLLLFLVNPSEPRRGEQRVSLKFLVKSGNSPIECWRALWRVFGDETMSQTQVQVWHKRFREGLENVKDKQRSGRPRSKRTTENIERVRQMVDEDGRMSLNDLVDRTGLSKFVVLRILKDDLKMTKRAAKFVPRILTEGQMETRKVLCQQHLDTLCAAEDPEQFLSRIITSDETWLSTFEPETKVESSVWLRKGDPHPKKSRSCPGGKTMLTLFFDIKGIVMIEFLEKGKTITAKRYCETLSKLKECLRKKRPELLKDCSFLIHQDNAPVHNANETKMRMTKWNMTILEHPAYSPDVAPCDFSLFPKLKSQLRGWRFNTIQEVQTEARKILLSMDKSVFSDTMHDLVLRWQKCVAANGSYFEGEHVQIDPLFVRGSQDSSTEAESEIESEDA